MNPRNRTPSPALRTSSAFSDRIGSNCAIIGVRSLDRVDPVALEEMRTYRRTYIAQVESDGTEEATAIANRRNDGC